MVMGPKIVDIDAYTEMLYAEDPRAAALEEEQTRQEEYDAWRYQQYLKRREQREFKTAQRKEGDRS